MSVRQQRGVNGWASKAGGASQSGAGSGLFPEATSEAIAGLRREVTHGSATTAVLVRQ